MDPPKCTLKILGTNHIAEESVRDIKKTFKEFKPDVIAVELDKRRLQSLQERLKGAKQSIPLSMIRHVGLTGFLFMVIGAFVQKKLGNIVHVQPGMDMLTTIQEAKKIGKPTFLVDQDVMITMRHLSKAFTWREKFQILWDVIASPFSKIDIKIDIRKVPDKKTIKQLLQLLKERYPSIYNVLIIERNVVMATRIDRIIRAQPGKKILLVVGAGHEEDLTARFKVIEHLVTVV
ncbi:MAG: TraB/GumN family protein [Candidatus Woesearchaeota archaeon]|nr:TraB/GumN family protein [Candidatus Woesearchaeota archaeon]